MKGSNGNDVGAIISCADSFVSKGFPGYRLTEVTEVSPPKRGLSTVKGKLKARFGFPSIQPEPITLKIDAG